jgi:putative membrane protein
MAGFAIALILISAVEHIYFFVLEAILWTKPFGLKTFGMDAQKAAATAPLAVNQGVYNLFLAAGLIWGALAPAPFHVPVSGFFLGCVIVAAIVGWRTVSVRILLIQGLPATFAAIALAGSAMG